MLPHLNACSTNSISSCVSDIKWLVSLLPLLFPPFLLACYPTIVYLTLPSLPPCADHDGSGFRARGDQTVPTARADSRCRDLGLLSRRERLPDRLEEQLQVSTPQTTQPPLLKALQQNVHLIDLLLQHQPASQEEGPAHDSSPQQRHWLWRQHQCQPYWKHWRRWRVRWVIYIMCTHEWWVALLSNYCLLHIFGTNLLVQLPVASV